MNTGLLENVGDSNKHIIEEIVRQVGYLPEFSSGYFQLLSKSIGNRKCAFKEICYSLDNSCTSSVSLPAIV
jgi:hypothetical protein